MGCVDHKVFGIRPVIGGGRGGSGEGTESVRRRQRTRNRERERERERERCGDQSHTYRTPPQSVQQSCPGSKTDTGELLVSQHHPEHRGRCRVQWTSSSYGSPHLGQGATLTPLSGWSLWPHHLGCVCVCVRGG